VEDSGDKEEMRSKLNSQVDFCHSHGFELEDWVAMGLEEDDLVGGLSKGFDLLLTSLCRSRTSLLIEVFW
jgi:hypothetical protein